MTRPKRAMATFSDGVGKNMQFGSEEFSLTRPKKAMATVDRSKLNIMDEFIFYH